MYLKNWTLSIVIDENSEPSYSGAPVAAQQAMRMISSSDNILPEEGGGIDPFLTLVEAMEARELIPA